MSVPVGALPVAAPTSIGDAVVHAQRIVLEGGRPESALDLLLLAAIGHTRSSSGAISKLMTDHGTTSLRMLAVHGEPDVSGSARAIATGAPVVHGDSYHLPLAVADATGGRVVVGVVALAGSVDTTLTSVEATLLPLVQSVTFIIESMRQRHHSEAVAADAALDRTRIEQFAAVLALTPDLVGIADADGVVQWLNPAGMALLGDSENRRVGDRHSAATRRQMVEEAVPTAIATGHWVGETEFQRPDGTVIPMSQVLIAPKGPDGRPLFIGTIARDISEAKEVERMRNRFIATVSHELRTPLTSLRGSLGLLAGGAMGAMPRGMEQLLGIATTNVDRLIELVNDILDLERLAVGTAVAKISMDPRGLLRESAEVVQGAATARSVEIVVLDDVPSGTRIVGDRARLRQALVNLVGNAVKFTRPETQVTLTARVGDGQLQMAVTDQGPGIAPEDLDRMFEPFVQLDAGGAAASSGSGLGLAIVRRTIELHGGEVSAWSDGLHGARFEVRVPLAAEPATATTATT